MLYKKPLLELTTVPGLEGIVAEEARPYGLEARYRPLSGRVYATCSGCVNVARLLRTVENVRLLFGEAEDIESLVQEVAPVYREYARGLSLFSVHAERISKDIDATSPEIASIVGRLVEGITGLHVSLDFPDIVFYVEYERGVYRAGVELTAYRGLRDRPYRLYVHRTALNPVIAAAMCMLVKDAYTVYDPFCGSGTILMECTASGKLAMGSDISEEFVRGASLNSRFLRGGGGLMLAVSDVCRSPFQGHVDAVVTNPPFGIRERAVGGLEGVYRSLFRSASRLSAKKVVVLTNRGRLVKKYSGASGYVLLESIPIIEGGKRSAVYVYGV